MDPIVEAGMGYAVGGGAQIAEMVYVSYATSHENRLDRAKVLLGIETAMTLTAIGLLYFGWKEKNVSMTNIGFGLLTSRVNWSWLRGARVL